MQVAHLDILEQNHVPTEQARAILRVIDESVKERENLTATKADIHELEVKAEQTKGGIELKLEQVEKTLTVKIERVKSELLFWFVGITFGQSAFLWYVLKGSTY